MATGDWSSDVYSSDLPVGRSLGHCVQVVNGSVPDKQNGAHGAPRETGEAITESLGQFVLPLWEKQSVWSTLRLARHVSPPNRRRGWASVTQWDPIAWNRRGSPSDTQRPCRVGFVGDGGPHSNLERRGRGSTGRAGGGAG